MHFLCFSNIDWTTVSGVSSAVIALAALIYAVWQGRQNQLSNRRLMKHGLWQLRESRRQARASVRPHISSWGNLNTNEYKYDLVNIGLGPAIIKKTEIYFDGETVKTTVKENAIASAVMKALPRIQTDFFERSYLACDHGIAPGEQITLLWIKLNTATNPYSKEEMDRAFERIDIIVHYESLYGESFTFSSKAQKLKSEQAAS